MRQSPISWIADPDGSAAEPVRRWLEDSGCDAWLLHYRTDKPLETAAVWNQTESGDAGAVRARSSTPGWRTTASSVSAGSPMGP